MADLALMENIEKKTGPIEEGRMLKIMNLNLDEIKILLGSEKVTKNQKKRLLKRQKENSQKVWFLLKSDASQKDMKNTVWNSII